MNKFLPVLAAGLGFAAPPSQGAVSIDLQADMLQTSSPGVAAPTTTLVLVVVSTADDGFGPITAGSSTALGAVFGDSNDHIVARLDLSTNATPGYLGEIISFPPPSIPGLAAGNRIALYWFPGLTLASSTVSAGNAYGRFAPAGPGFNAGVDGSSAWVMPADPASAYPLYFFNGLGTIQSGSSPAAAGVASLAVEQPPAKPLAIDTQPQNQVVPEGNQAQFSVVASGEGPFTYQWEFDPEGGPAVFEPLPGEVSSTLSRAALAANIGSYRVVVSNDSNSVTSNAATLAFGSHLIVIDQQPAPKIIAAGGAFELSVATSGGRPQTFQWYFNDEPLADETNPVLAISDAPLTRAGKYFCRIKNVLVSGSDEKDSAAVTVAVVDTKASRFVVTSPGIANLSVTTASHSSDPLSYQWFLDLGPAGSPNPVLVSGATARTLSVIGVSTGRKRYFCRVTAAGGTLNGGDNVVVGVIQAPELQPAGEWDLPGTTVSEPYAFQVPLAEDPFEPGTPDPMKAPASFKAVGLPPGLKIGSTGLITGRATVEKRDKFGAVIPYTVTITATNKFGTTAPVVKTLLVNPLNSNLIGVYTGPVERSVSLNGSLGGVFNMTTTKTGTYTGKLVMGAKTYAFKGALDSSTDDPENPTATLTVNRGTALPPLTVELQLSAVTGLITTGTITDGTTSADFEGWRKVWLKTAANPAPAQEFGGYYTLAMDLPAELQGTAANPGIPQGTGFASFTVNKVTGTLLVSGKLSDGTAFTTSTFAGPSGEVLVFKTLYSAKALGSVVGSLEINPEAAGNFDDNTLAGTLSWWKPAQAGRSYAEGWQPIDLAAVGSRYNPPPAGTPVMGLAAPSLPGQINAVLELLEANVETAQPAADRTGFSVSSLNKAVADANNPRKKTLVINAKTGAISGKFTLSQPHPFGGIPATITRVVAYQGLIVSNGVSQQGWGFFNLPELPSSLAEKTTQTRILSGQVKVEAAPAP